MFARVLGLSALCIAVPAGLTPPAARHYRIDQTTVQTVDQTSLGGPSRTDTSTTVTYVTLSSSDSAGGKKISVLVDSIVTDSASPVAKASLDSLRGQSYTGYLGQNREVTNLRTAAGDTANVPGLVENLIQELYPPVPKGVKSGQQWSDTSQRTRDIAGGHLTVKTITKYNAAGTAQRAGTDATKVQVSSDVTITGAQDTPQGHVDITGTASGTGEIYLGPDGQYLGGTHNNKSTLQIAPAGAPGTIPITGTQTTLITLVR